jgi:hypothetical protein
MTEQSQGWGVFELDDGVHVAPTVDGGLLASHVLRWDCRCRPTADRDGPLDDPICSHNEPGWPGADPGPIQ